MIPIRRIGSDKLPDIINFLNDYLREIVTNINKDVRINWVTSYVDKAPDPKDGQLAYFPAKPAQAKDRPPRTEYGWSPGTPNAGQGLYIYLIDWVTPTPDPLPTPDWKRTGKWYKIDISPVPEFHI